MKNKFIRAMAIGSIILIVSVLAGLLFGSVQSALIYTSAGITLSFLETNDLSTVS